jgi:hypothetical protein
LARWRQDGRHVAAWGAGAKAVGFLNMLKDREVISRVVDINPHKQGRYLAGTGQKIVPPGTLAADPPDVIVIMNPVYRKEIVEQVSALGLSPELIAA